MSLTDQGVSVPSDTNLPASAAMHMGKKVLQGFLLQNASEEMFSFRPAVPIPCESGRTSTFKMQRQLKMSPPSLPPQKRGQYILLPNIVISGIHPHLQAQGNPSRGSNLRCSAVLQEMETAADTGRLLNRLLEKGLISLPALTHMSRSCKRHGTLNTKAELETGYVGAYPGVMGTKVQ